MTATIPRSFWVGSKSLAHTAYIIRSLVNLLAHAHDSLPIHSSDFNNNFSHYYNAIIISPSSFGAVVVIARFFFLLALTK
jgi:hypothetical protein